MSLREKSFADLHRDLGDLVSKLPTQCIPEWVRTDRFDENHFAKMQIEEVVRGSLVLDAVLDQARAQDPNFDARCQAEWDATDVPALITAQKAKRKASK